MNKEFMNVVRSKATTIGDFLMFLNITVNGYLFYRDFVKPRLERQEQKVEDEEIQLEEQ